jgi:iron complex outermembrane receptor protein
MRKISALVLFILFFSIAIYAQKGIISGVVTDSITGESIIGVNIIYGKGLGTITDINGKYSIQLPYGDHILSISYVGYISLEKKVKISVTPLIQNFSLSNITLSEVVIVADIARQRETPIAFSNVTPLKIQEQLAGRDIPMLLTSTPGIYATQMGGGDGDARITIRGFSSRNVGVLLDGVPVNDMENGTVYWSNWFGLDAVTRNIQVQRGLGASKLALPSVGGTINILTKGIDERQGGILKQELGSDGYLNTSFGYNSGKLAQGQGIGFTIAGCYKQGDGWVDHTWSKAFFLYGKVDKFIGKHIVSFAAYGAPQSHGQRSYNLPAAVYNQQWAEDHGVDSLSLTKYKPSAWKNNTFTYNHGLKFNQHWGQIENYTINNYNKYDVNGNPLADTINRGSFSGKNERVNEYLKPQFTLKDFWTINSKLSLSNILYLSLGRGGGIRAKNNLTVLPNGEMDFQSVYDYNSFHPIAKVDTFYSTTLRTAGNFLVERKNDHRWFGLLSTFNYTYSPSITMAGGIDLRDYKGIHYEEIYDLVGADYIKDASDQSMSYLNPDGTFNFKKAMRYVGDKINYYNDGLVRWGGAFYQVEYKKERLSAFVNLTAASTGYKRVDHFKPDSLQETPWKWINGFTIKSGANYNITKHFSAFINIGYLDKAPRFSNVYDNNNKLYRDIENEKVRAVEFGLAYASPKFSVNVNTYYTNWLNRPVDYAPAVAITDTLGGQTSIYYANINGLAAVHKGIEFDFALILSEKIRVQGLFSLGDWKWNSADSVRVRDDYGQTVLTQYLNAKGLHVGDAAQFQVGGEIRYEPIHDLYVSGNFTYFDKYYSNFDPMSYDAANPANSANFDADGNPIDPWQIPSYALIDLHAGYAYKISKKYRLQFRANVINLFNTVYVSDADDNSRNIGQSFNSHDARSAAVFFGLGRRYTISVAFLF